MKENLDPMGPPGVEPGTSRLSGVRSNHLSYRPSWATAVATAAHLRGQPAQTHGPAYSPHQQAGNR